MTADYIVAASFTIVAAIFLFCGRECGRMATMHYQARRYSSAWREWRAVIAYFVLAGGLFGLATALVFESPS